MAARQARADANGGGVEDNGSIREEICGIRAAAGAATWIAVAREADAITGSRYPSPHDGTGVEVAERPGAGAPPVPRQADSASASS